jgi:Mg-chelatase subunit ChlD
MLSSLLNVAKTGLGVLQAAIPIGLKTIKYFVDSTFRDKVVPVPGSVLYCDLWLAVEHSGIYVSKEKISNIVVDGLAESTVSLSSPQSFTSKSSLGRKIYVSCDKNGAVGHSAVARVADAHVGERAFYGLVIKNCHQFSTKCVNYAEQNDESFFSKLPSFSSVGETWEPTMLALKNAAREQLGATKWRLWDWDNDAQINPPPEPDWKSHQDYFKNQPLNKESIEQIRAELAAMKAYEAEISDEAIPDTIRQRLGSFRKTLVDISKKYEEVKDFLAACPDAKFSYNELKACSDDFAALAQTLQNSEPIKELARKMGRNYISEEKKKQARIPQASKSEVHGTHRSDDVMRMLPSELLNLEDEELEVLFYARLLEKNLLTYELQGVTFINGEETETSTKRTGPVVACLDTSGSMRGAPLLKAKALLLAIANILKQEDRSLHVLLFGSSGEIREFSMDGQNNSVGLLKFLQQGFGGGTDFETPLKYAFEIIALQKDYVKADVLMISDGDCNLSAGFIKTVKIQKGTLDCMIYSVLCAGGRVEDKFSDEIVVL